MVKDTGSVRETTLKALLYKLPVTRHWKLLNYSNATLKKSVACKLQLHNNAVQPVCKKVIKKLTLSCSPDMLSNAFFGHGKNQYTAQCGKPAMCGNGPLTVSNYSGMERFWPIRIEGKERRQHLGPKYSVVP